MPLFQFRHTTTDEITYLEGPTPLDVDGLLPEGTYAVRALSDEAPDTISIAPAATPGAVPGAVGHWTFGTDAQTLAGNPLTLVGPAPALSPGFATLPVAKPRGFNTGIPDTGPITLCAVIRLTTGQGNAIIFGNGDSVDGRFLVYSDGVSTLRFRTDPGANLYDFDQAAPTGDWIFVAVSLTDTTLNAYRGGIGAPAVTFSGPYVEGSRGRDIGIANIAFTSGSPGAPMDIAEAFLFTEPKTLAELEALHGDRVADLSARGVGLAPPFSDAQADPGASQPAAPTDLRLVAMSNALGIYWQEPANGPAPAYQAEIDGVEQAPTSILSMHLDSVMFKTYSVRVRGLDSLGNPGPWCDLVETQIHAALRPAQVLQIMGSVRDGDAEFFITPPGPVAFDPVGRPFLITNGEDYTVVRDTPDGGVQANGRIGNGMQVNPAFVRDFVGDIEDADNGQGLDQMMADGGDGTTRVAYVSALNKSTEMGGPLEIKHGSQLSLFKFIRRDQSTLRSWGGEPPANANPHGDTSVLTVMPHTLPDDTLRPPPTPLNKIPYLKFARNWNPAAFRRLAPPPDMPGYTYEEVIANTIKDHAFFGIPGREELNTYGPDEDFSTRQQDKRKIAWFALHENILDDDQKRHVGLIMATIANDIAAVMDLGWTGHQGAAQGYGIIAFAYIGAFALNDADLLQAAQNLRSGEISYGKHIWQDESHLNAPLPWPESKGKLSRLPSGATIRQMGRVMIQADGFDIKPNARYKPDVADNAGKAVLPIMLLQNGPGGISGTQAITQSDETIGPSNRLSAAIASFDIAVNDVTSVDLDQRRYTAAWRTAPGMPPVYEEGPMGLDQPNSGPDKYQPGSVDGSVAFDWSGIGRVPGTLQDVLFRYSLDKRFWVTGGGYAIVDEHSGLTHGQTYYVGAALRDTLGRVGEFSPNQRESWHNNGGDSVPKTEANAIDPIRGTVVTPGTSTAAPTWINDPVWAFRPYEATQEEQFETYAADAVNHPDTMRAYPSLGMLDTRPETTFRYRILRNDAEIVGWTVFPRTDPQLALPGIDNAFYERTPDDLSTTANDTWLTFEIEADDQHGNVETRMGPRLYMPTVTPMSAGAVFETQFQPRLQLERPTVWANRLGLNGNDRLDTRTFEGASAPGYYGLQKAGANPVIRFAPITGLSAGQRYRIRAEVIIGTTKTTVAQLRGSAGLNIEMASFTPAGGRVRTIDHDYTVQPEQEGSNLIIDIRHLENTGGTAGGQSGLASLRVDLI